MDTLALADTILLGMSALGQMLDFFKISFSTFWVGNLEKTLSVALVLQLYCLFSVALYFSLSRLNGVHGRLDSR